MVTLSDASARALALDRAMEEYIVLHGARYNKNRAAAHACEDILPPRVKEKMDELIEKAGLIQGQVNVMDDVNPTFDARVPTLKNTFVTSRLAGSTYYMVNGVQKQGAVSCTCGAPRTDGFPCVHNVKHALHIGRDPCEFVHYLDTTEAWEQQYDQDDEFPVIGPEEYKKADFDKNLQYPPVPPPKVGRPKKEGRIKGGKEKAMAWERKRALPVCSACNKAGHISTNSK